MKSIYAAIQSLSADQLVEYEVGFLKDALDQMTALFIGLPEAEKEATAVVIGMTQALVDWREAQVSRLKWLDDLLEGKDDQSYGQIAFEAYAIFKRGKTYDGKPIPPWKDVGLDVQAAWDAAALAVGIVAQEDAQAGRLIHQLPKNSSLIHLHAIFGAAEWQVTIGDVGDVTSISIPGVSPGVALRMALQAVANDAQAAGVE